MSAFVVISAVMWFCRDGSSATSDICANGLPRVEAEVSILKGEFEPKDCPTPFKDEAWRTCPIEWTALVEIDEDKRPLMIIRPDGKLETSEGFRADQGARLFWDTLAEVLRQQIH